MSKSLPVFTFGLSPEKNHIKLLQNKGLIYNNESELVNLLIDFEKHKIEYSNMDEFAPENVTKKFYNVFLK
jgi:hypothetical protein